MTQTRQHTDRVLSPFSIFNTLSGEFEELHPVHSGLIGIYSCGPTVFPTESNRGVPLGNYRAYIIDDILRRSLEKSGYTVRHIMNVTDIKYTNVLSPDMGELKKIAREEEKRFVQERAELNIIPPSVLCRASEHVTDMIAFIQELERKGYTENIDGNVCFNLSKFLEENGAVPLHNLMGSFAAAKTNATSSSEDKRSLILWRSKKTHPKQSMFWDSPWGIGTPGWHIECSTLASEYLGAHFDIHTGSTRHIDKHHKYELMQSLARFGHKWVNHWIHVDAVDVDKVLFQEIATQKPDKDKKLKAKDVDLNDLKALGYDPLHFKFLVLKTHYRKKLTLDRASLDAAKEQFERLVEIYTELSKQPSISLSYDEDAHVSRYMGFAFGFLKKLGTPPAIDYLLRITDEKHFRDGDPVFSPQVKLAFLKSMDSLLGLGIAKSAEPGLSLKEDARSSMKIPAIQKHIDMPTA